MSFVDKFLYDKEKYNFREIIEKVLGVKGLETLHLEANFSSYKLLSREEDQGTIYHKRYYDNLGEFLNMYDLFVKDYIRPRLREPVIYQKIPTFRIHLPNNVAVGEWHKDRKYRNSDWAQKVKEMNYYLPLTRAFASNTVWAESQEDKEDFKPMESDYGEVIEWDASNLTHGNKQNITGFTRVSVDFRVVPKTRYIDSSHLTINTKVPFSIGGYYKECK